MIRAILLSLVLCTACGGSGASRADAVSDRAADRAAADGTPDAGTDLAPDAGTDARAEAVAPPPLAAFPITSDQELLPGREAAGRVGDFRIQNAHLVAVLGAAGHTRWGPYGGGVLDLAVPGDEDRFEEQFPIAGFLRAVRIDSMEVVKDGSDGEALVRVTGRDGPVPLVATVANPPPAGITVVVEYRLTAESRCLEIRTAVTNPTDHPVLAPVGDGVVFSESGRTFGSGAGYDTVALLGQGPVSWLGSEEPRVSFLLAAGDTSAMSVALIEQELNVVFYDSHSLEPGQTGESTRCLYVAPGLSLGVLSRYREDRGVPQEDATGTVALETPGYDLAGLSLEVWREDAFYGAANPDPSGALAFRLPAGSYLGTLTGAGFTSVPAAWEVTLGQTPAPLALDPADPGRIDVAITDADGAAMPARITVQSGSDADPFAPRVGLVPDLEGRASFFVPAGNYTVQGSRGPEWGLCRVPVGVNAGQVAATGCALAREVDTTGWIPADMHCHSEWGIDSHLPREDRVRAEVAEGLRFFVGTDHDVFTDFAPVIEALGAGELIGTAVGNEVSPVGRHFNGLGCAPPMETLLQYFVIPWAAVDADGEVAGALPEPSIWTMMREDFACRVVQINHPRDGQGYLDLVGYDPAGGPSSALPGRFDMTFDALEVWNSSDAWSHLAGKTLPDWYSFLNRGYRTIATGNPDTHGLDQWAGQPRNLVPVEGELTESAYFDALLASRSQVTSAPLLTLTVDGQGLGATVVPVAPDAALEVHVRVEAASWVPLDTVQLIGNGEVVQSWDVAGVQETVRLDESLDVTPATDAWYHLVAFSTSGSLSPVYPGRASAGLTNPIWVDRDGDGFDPLITEE